MKIIAKKIEKSFGSNKVLFDASIDIFPGEVHSLMGENGAGKSTLMNIISGSISCDGGQILFDNQVVVPFENKSSKISFIRQEFNLVDEMSVYENVYLGKMGKTIVDDSALIKASIKLFQKLGISIDVTQKIHSLSIGEKQLVEIAKGLTESCEVLIMDEPTAALSTREIKKLFDIIKQLKKEDVAIIYISHRMNEIFEISDKITVMRDGQYINTFIPNKITEEVLINNMVGREIEFTNKKKQEKFGEIVLEVNKISSVKNKYANISFKIRAGEIVALTGLMGSKRTEVLEAIANYKKIDSGSIMYFGKEISKLSIKQTINSGIAFLTEDRKSTGLFLNESIIENIAIPNASSVSKKGIIDFKKQENLADYFIEKINVKCKTGQQLVGSLSGGNQQKIVLSKWLATMPKLLLLDEPTRGIDVNAKREIYLLIEELAKTGIAIIFVSSEMSEVLMLSDTIVILNEGKQRKVILNKNLTEEKILNHMIGDSND